MNIHPSLVDHAKTILQNAPITDDAKSVLWTIWHDEHTVTSLARRLTELDAELPPDIEQALLAAKKLSAPAPDAIDKVLDTISHMDPKTLALAESHPAVLRVLADAVKE
jgi:hypothetical protein